MLKGTMKIELTDVNTGETETVLEQNMVTNALAEIFKPLGLEKTPSKFYNDFAPYYQKLLGGILLFDTNIEENADNLYPPASANLIGCAAYGVQNNTTGTLRGGYNQTESELNLTNRYMKYVYDFATSQANGTISCVCLTHKNGGYTSYGSDDAIFTTSYPIGLFVGDGQLQYVYTDYTGASTGDKYSGLSIGTTQLLFLIDRNEDVVYYFRIDSSSKITIIKRRAYLKSVSVLLSPRTQKQYVDEVAIELNTALPTNYTAYNFDHSDNCLYIFSSSGYYKNAGESFIVTKIDIKDWTVSQYEMVNTTDTSINTGHTRFAFAHEGFIYVKSYNSSYRVYKMELGNAANVTKLKLTGTSNVTGSPMLAYNGRIYYENTDNTLYIANAETNEILRPENYRITTSSYMPCYTPVLNEPMLYYCSYGNRSTSTFFIMANYLATINNLTEPVTKTADKTMKITYIVQEQ